MIKKWFRAKSVPSQSTKKGRLDYEGFTLIELMITVAIIGILAVVAYPSYSDYVTRTNRTLAADKISEVMFELERFQIRQRTYTTNLTDLGYTGTVYTEGDLYTISLGTCAASTQLADCVKVSATPTAGKRQAAQGEAALTLDSLGTREGKWEE